MSGRDIIGVKDEELLRDEYEFYEEWKNSDARDEGISLEVYDRNRRMQEYGLELDDLDEDAYDEAHIY